MFQNHVEMLSVGLLQLCEKLHSSAPYYNSWKQLHCVHSCYFCVFAFLLWNKLLPLCALPRKFWVTASSVFYLDDTLCHMTIFLLKFFMSWLAGVKVMFSYPIIFSQVTSITVIYKLFEVIKSIYEKICTKLYEFWMR